MDPNLPLGGLENGSNGDGWAGCFLLGLHELSVFEPSLVSRVFDDFDAVKYIVEITSENGDTTGY